MGSILYPENCKNEPRQIPARLDVHYKWSTADPPRPAILSQGRLRVSALAVHILDPKEIRVGRSRIAYVTI